LKWFNYIVVISSDLIANHKQHLDVNITSDNGPKDVKTQTKRQFMPKARNQRKYNSQISTSLFTFDVPLKVRSVASKTTKQSIMEI